jgi:two-component system OmpR family sensor kinase
MTKSQVSSTGLLDRVSLRTRLTIIAVSLIGVLILMSSLGTLAVLRTYLQQNVDATLKTAASALRTEDPALLQDRLSAQLVQLPRLPSDYYIAYLDSKGELLVGLVSSASKGNAVPDLKGFTASWVSRTRSHPFEFASRAPATATGSATQPDKLLDLSTWRMIAVPLTATAGSLVIALPTNSNSQLLNQYGVIGAGFGALLLVISGAAIWITISSALRPLREVERTAQAVAKGDFSRRLVDSGNRTEIGRINFALNSMLSGIENAIKSRNKTLDQMRRFVSDASHELRTPLVSVRGYAELYRMGALKKESDVAEAMKRIESEAIRMTELVESLLTLARLDEASQLETSTTDLLTLAREAAKDSSVADHNREIKLIDLQSNELPSDATLLADVNGPAIRQVLTNLLSNASKFSSDSASIEIAIGEAPNQRIVIEVRDHGEGIPNELRQKVFERFYRADNSRNRETGGSGIGLAIVSGIVKQHGGDIVALETPGGGATMRVSLPKAQKHH